LSSILKALKRIEVQSPRSESFFTMPKTIDTKQASNSKERRRWLVPGLISILLVLLVVVFAVIIFLNQRQPVITKKFPAGVSGEQRENSASLLEKSNIFRAKIPPESTNLTEKPPRKAQLAKNQQKSTVPAELPVKMRAMVPDATADQQNSKQTSTQRSRRPRMAATLKKPPQKRPTSKDAAAPKKTVAAKSVPSGKPSTKAKKPDRTRTYDRIADSKLKLQALAWFSDASKRMAVINSHIVREGGSVDGYQVTQIRRQDVVISDGRKLWSLEFGLKY
jgi:type IV secretory pathway VirB10-like protein